MQKYRSGAGLNSSSVRSPDILQAWPLTARPWEGIFCCRELRRAVSREVQQARVLWLEKRRPSSQAGERVRTAGHHWADGRLQLHRTDTKGGAAAVHEHAEGLDTNEPPSKWLAGPVVT